MTPRPNPFTAHFGLVTPLIEFGKYTQEGIDPTIAELVKIRASQINGCATCLLMHTRDARKHGETEDRLHMIAAWHESTLYSERERAVLAWTEALTRMHDVDAPDKAYEALKAHFNEEEQIRITLLVGAINAFNRLNVGFHVPLPVTDVRQVA